MTINVVAPKLAGHRLNYVRTLVDHVSDPARFRILTSSAERPAKIDELRRILDSAGTGLGVIDLGPHDAVGWASHISSSSSPSLAMELDDLLVPLSRACARGVVGGLLMRPWDMGGVSPRLRISQMLKRFLVMRMLWAGRLTGVALLRQGEATFRGCNPPVYEVPDPITLPTSFDLTGQARAGGVVTVAIAGGIDRRKHPLLVLDAVDRVDASSTSTWRLQLYGTPTTEVAASLESARRKGAIVVESGWLPDEELWRRIAAADITACVHRNPGPSGIVGLSVGLGTPVVVLDHGDPARFVSATATGIVASRPTTAAVARALVSARERQDELQGAAELQRDTLRASPARFAQVLSSLVAS